MSSAFAGTALDTDALHNFDVFANLNSSAAAPNVMFNTPPTVQPMAYNTNDLVRNQFENTVPPYTPSPLPNYNEPYMDRTNPGIIRNLQPGVFSASMGPAQQVTPASQIQAQNMFPPSQPAVQPIAGGQQQLGQMPSGNPPMNVITPGQALSPDDKKQLEEQTLKTRALANVKYPKVYKTRFGRWAVACPAVGIHCTIVNKKPYCTLQFNRIMANWNPIETKTEEGILTKIALAQADEMVAYHQAYVASVTSPSATTGVLGSYTGTNLPGVVQNLVYATRQPQPEPAKTDPSFLSIQELVSNSELPIVSQSPSAAQQRVTSNLGSMSVPTKKITPLGMSAPDPGLQMVSYQNANIDGSVNNQARPVFVAGQVDFSQPRQLYF